MAMTDPRANGWQPVFGLGEFHVWWRPDAGVRRNWYRIIVRHKNSDVAKRSYATNWSTAEKRFAISDDIKRLELSFPAFAKTLRMRLGVWKPPQP